MMSLQVATVPDPSIQDQELYFSALSATYFKKKKVTDCHKQVWKRKDGLEEDVKTLKNQVDIEKGKLKVCKSQLGLKEEELNESKVAVENLN
jgi:chaperonin cofactor prefoldin